VEALYAQTTLEQKCFSSVFEQFSSLLFNMFSPCSVLNNSVLWC